MTVVWIAGEYHIGQESTVHGRNDEGVEREVGNQDEAVNGIPSANRRTD